VREFDPARFGDGEEHHGITVDQLDLREVYGDDTALLERRAKDVHVVPGNPPTDAQDDIPLDPNSVDPAGHRRVACRATYGKRDANEKLTESGANSRSRSAGHLVNPRKSVDVVNLVNV
jgi:hypothetical protein